MGKRRAAAARQKVCHELREFGCGMTYPVAGEGVRQAAVATPDVFRA
jgi:hypothetical protein